MKIRLLTYPWAGLNNGGLQLQIGKTLTELNDLGRDVSMLDCWRDDLSDCDVLHVFSLSDSCCRHVERAKEKHIPIVISTVFGVEGIRQLTRLKAYIAGKCRVVWPGLRASKRMLDAADRVICLNDSEASLLQCVFNVTREKITIVPNGIDSRFLKSDASLFSERYGIDNFVLQAARLAPGKNQLRLLAALKNVDCEVVIAGGESASFADYAAQCRRVASAITLFTGAIEYADPLLPSMFNAAKVFVLPSFSEVMPLSLYEAAASGCNLVCSRAVPVEPWLAPHVHFCSPSSTSSIRDAVERALASPNLDGNRFHQFLKTWREVAINIQQVYGDITS